jgi:hypothetical protein
VVSQHARRQDASRHYACHDTKNRFSSHLAPLRSTIPERRDFRALDDAPERVRARVDCHGASIADCRRGGRTWWAHFTITRVNIGPIILRNQFEDLMEILDFA